MDGAETMTFQTAVPYLVALSILMIATPIALIYLEDTKEFLLGIGRAFLLILLFWLAVALWPIYGVPVIIYGAIKKPRSDWPLVCAVITAFGGISLFSYVCLFTNYSTGL